jgi:hypothetical protein
MLKTPTQDPDDHAGPHQDREDDEIGDEEQIDSGDQPLPPDAPGERGVRVDDDDQDQRLARCRVLLHLGSAVEQNQRLARGLEQVVGAEQQEDRAREEGRRDRLCGFDPAEGADEVGERAFEAVRCGSGGRGHGFLCTLTWLKASGPGRALHCPADLG